MIQKLISPVKKFVAEMEWGGVMLLVVSILAMLAANSSLKEIYFRIWRQAMPFSLGGIPLKVNMNFLINDVLMTLFFVVVGCEIKREIVEGSLSSKEKAILPVIAALGGMLFPAVIYTAFNYNKPSLSGWAIPTATDIAFSLTIISLLGKRVPFTIKIFLASLAIADDLGAIIIIALFYSSSLNWIYLVLGAGAGAGLFLLNGFGARSLWIYCIIGLVLWYFFFKAGIHPTISGVILAMAVPFRGKAKVAFVNYGRISTETTIEDDLPQRISKIEENKEPHNDENIPQDKKAQPLGKLLNALLPFSNFIIMPLFAFANAGVLINTEALNNLFSSVSLGIMLGLMFGKSTGIVFFCWCAIKLKISSVQGLVSWKHIYGMAWVAGIGFTMSMFVTDLAFVDEETINVAKIAILIASTISGTVGYLILRNLKFH